MLLNCEKLLIIYISMVYVGCHDVIVIDFSSVNSDFAEIP